MSRLEPDVGANSTSVSVITRIAHLGPVAVYAEHFNPSRRDPDRHDQYFVCRQSHLRAAILARRARRVFTG